MRWLANLFTKPKGKPGRAPADKRFPKNGKPPKPGKAK